MHELLRDLISVSFLHSVIIAAAPLIVGGQGELLIERCGILNLAIAGMFALSASTAFIVSYAVGPGLSGILLGFLTAAATGAAIALLLGLFCITLRGTQITVGLALFMFSLGGAALFYLLAVGTSTQTKSVPTLPEIRIPGLASIPFLGQILFSNDLFVYAALLLTPAIAFLLYRTPMGLRLRAAGENPRCVDELGVSVLRVRYATLAVGGALIGLAGAFFPLGQLGSFSAATVTGQGWLALMLVIFGKWKPSRVFLGALLFAFVLALQFTVALSLPSLPPQLFLALPYVLAVVVLIRSSGRAEGPAALTKAYDREARV